MTNYRTTVILKTDIVDSTPRLAELTQSEMGLQRKQHKLFIGDTSLRYHGSIFQEEGDAYWIEFPSVTDAVLTAIEMHQNLRSMQAGKGEKRRLAIRAVITVGDILYQGADTMGMTMSLTARIEKITPPDEIYLSHAAWLVLNKAEVQTSLVGEFNLKGFNELEKIYRVDQKQRIRAITNQFIVFTDIRGWSSYTRSNELEDIENILMEYDDLINEICDSHNGVIRNTGGDQYFLTFPEAKALFEAVEDLCMSWKGILRRYQLGLSIAAHKGDLNIIRSYLFSNDIHTTLFLERLNPLAYPDRKTISVIVSDRIRESATGTDWEGRFQNVDVSKIMDDRETAIVKDYGAFWFIPKNE